MDTITQAKTRLISESPSLYGIENYKHDDLVSSFGSTYSISWENSLGLFKDMKLWLWLCNYASFDRNYSGVMTIYEPLISIDKMWHEFILFTKDYMSFCDDNFGYYLHHQPKTISSYGDTKSEDAEQRLNLAKNQCFYIQKLLGTSVLKRWYIDNPKKFKNIF